MKNLQKTNFSRRAVNSVRSYGFVTTKSLLIRDFSFIKDFLQHKETADTLLAVKLPRTTTKTK